MDSDTSFLSDVSGDVLQQVFGKLPFPDLVRLRVVCRKWNTMISSLYFAPPQPFPKCVPVHFLNDELTVYNSCVKAWQKHSLSFFQDNVQTPRLELVASTGGLLCFETDMFGQLIVCNPISKMWKVLQIPSAPTADPASPTVVVESPRSYFSGGYLHRPPPVPPEVVLRKRTTIVGLMVDPVKGNHYKIVVASLQDSLARSTVVYDSRTSTWRRGSDVPDGEEFSGGSAILCNGCLYCLVKTETSNGELFRYDVNSDEWSTLSLDMSVMRCKLVEHCGQIFMVKRSSYYSDESAFRFFQLREFTHLPDVTDDESMMSLEETDLIENLNLDMMSIIRVMGHLKSTGRGTVLGQKNFLYVLKPPYEDGLRKKRTLVTIIDLSTGSCEVLHEMVVAASTNADDSAPAEYRIRNVFHLFSPSVTVQV